MKNTGHFFKLAIFLQKNISLSLCRQIAKLKLPTFGQGLSVRIISKSNLKRNEKVKSFNILVYKVPNENCHLKIGILKFLVTYISAK